MLSTVHRQFSPMFSPLSPDFKPFPTELSTSHTPRTDSLSSVPFSPHHMQSIPMPSQDSVPTLKSPTRARQHSIQNSQLKAKEPRRRNSEVKSDEKIAASGPVRKRISRACDQCNQLRTKCDGKSPCAHCVEFGLGCEYFRKRKKRGKASRKDLAQQQASDPSAFADAPSPSGYSSDVPSPTQSGHADQDPVNGEYASTAELPPPPIPRKSMSGSDGGMLASGTGDAVTARTTRTREEMPSETLFSQHHPRVSNIQKDVYPDFNRPQENRSILRESPGPMSLNGFNVMQDYGRSSMHGLSSINGSHNGHAVHHLPNPTGTTNGYSTYEGAYSLVTPHNSHAPVNYSFGRNHDSPLTSFLAASPVEGSPGWLSLPSPTPSVYQPQHLANPPPILRYPVLQPLLPSIASVLPTSLACDLLELYFTSSSSSYVHPLSPYLLGYVFRKRSFLHPTRPRACSSALLCSMLWVGAQTSDAPFLTSPPSARGRICQKLLEVTVGLLRPLIHGACTSDMSPSYGMRSVVNGLALGGLGVATTSGDQVSALSGATGGLNDVATYFHLATVISASEYKAASLRWWNAAWSLARELKLGREVPPNPPQPGGKHQPQGDDMDADGEVDLDMTDQNGPNIMSHMSSENIPVPPGTMGEEEREERRRIWWLLYTVDRHLALCYNRPLFLLDIECDGLLQPVSDIVWQAGDVYTGKTGGFSSHSDAQHYRRAGPSFECTGHSIFGYFLPLMTILGQIVDLNHTRNHPRFGLGFRGGNEWDDRSAGIIQQLEAYGRSLKDFEARCTTSASSNEQNDRDHANAEVGTPSVRSATSTSSRITESMIQTKTVVAYGTHVMHVLHILLTGKWDPISLLDDNDLWISSQSFITATGHAVSAAEAISDILEYDPDLSFMPFFMGIYLLQGSFLLLLIADKLQGEASPSVVKACETIVRAHEACVVTLNTEYQRNFRKVMRSALAQVKGRVPEDFGEQQLRRREVLALYRWTGDGTGLAL
ncbi:hypothetical protein MMC13_006311 [Lambiella insularis]|nr:hypothetical protein [Lambiella insularis]